MFEAVLALIKAIPVFQQWVERFMAWYIERQIAGMRQENRDAIRKAFEQHDTRDLEKAIGNPHAGEPSELPGTVVRDTLPGVHNPSGD